jgi:hypothetical protein
MHADAVVKSKPGPDGGQVHLLLCMHASVTRQATGRVLTVQERYFGRHATKVDSVAVQGMGDSCEVAAT